MTDQTTLTRAILREGTERDTAMLRRVFETAGQGLAEHFWHQAHDPGMDFDAMVEGRMRTRIADPANRFRVAEIDGTPAGGILSYEKGAEADDPGDAGPMLRALIEAENDLVGTHYINALAVFSGQRGRGIGSALVRDLAASTRQPLSLIVADGNPDALRLYQRLGFVTIDRHPMLAEGWEPNGTHWITMVQKGESLA